jgi:hypothetical protein
MNKKIKNYSMVTRNPVAEGILVILFAVILFSLF